MSRSSSDRESGSRWLTTGVLLLAAVVFCIWGEVIRPDPPDPGLDLNTAVVVTSDGGLEGVDILMEWYGPYEPPADNPLAFVDGGRGIEPWSLRIVIQVRDPGSPWEVEILHPEWLNVSDTALEDGPGDVTGRRSSYANVPAGTGSFVVDLKPPDRGPGSIDLPDVHGSVQLTFPAVSLGINGTGEEGDELGQIEYRTVVDNADIIQVTGPRQDGAFTWQRQLVNGLYDPGIWQYERQGNVPQLGPIRLDSLKAQESDRRAEFKSGIFYGIGVSAGLGGFEGILVLLLPFLGRLLPQSRRPTSSP